MNDIRLSTTWFVRAICVVLLLPFLQPTGAAETVTAISAVSVSRSVFNPDLGQTVRIGFTIAYSGAVDVLILDRDGYVVRTLCSNKKSDTGELKLEWDGRNDSGEIVPNEVYSLKIDLKSQDKSDSYFPANAIPDELPVHVSYYDRQNGVFSYSLPKAGRVHIQAGCAVTDPKTKKPKGPVMKTIANREPRAGGACIEQWSGYDESSTIYIPDLPNFVTAVYATACPENSIIVIGNHPVSFLDTVSKRKGNSLFTFSVKDRHHHRGLSALEDTSPALVLKPENAVWDPKERLWQTSETDLKIHGSLKGPSADAFSKQPGIVAIFVDGQPVTRIPPPGLDFSVSLSLSKGSRQPHIIALNWGSDYGPTAVNSFRVVLHEPSPGKELKKSKENH